MTATTDPKPPVRVTLARRATSLAPAAAAALTALALSGGVAGYVLGERDRAAVAAGNALILGLEGTLSAMKDVETGQRGFLLVGREDYLEPYAAGRAEAEARLAELGRLAAAAGLPPEDRLAALVRRRQESAARSIEMRRAGADAEALRLAETGEGKAAMDALRAEVARRTAQAQTAIAAAEARAAARGFVLPGLSLGAALLAAGLLALYARARRRAERRANALLDGVMANAPIGLGFLDRDFRVVGGNRALAEIGREALGVELARGAALPEAVRGRVAARMRAVLAGRERADAELDAAPPGEAGGAPHHLRATLFPLRDGGEAEEDAGDGAGLVLEDITRRKRAEARLRRSEARFRTLVDSIPQLAWTADAEGALDWCNARWADFAGLPAEALRGWGWAALLRPEEAAEVEARLRAHLAAGEPWEEAMALRAADGGYRWFLARAVPVRDDAEEGGALTGWFAAAADVTDLREAEAAAAAARDAAEEANRAKSTFIANMSHELRTPLSAVIGYSEMLEEEAADLAGGDALTEDLRKIGTNARHLLSLINDVLDLSKIEAGRMEVQAEDFDVATLASEAAATVQALLERKGNALEVRVAEGIGRMHSDPVKIRQCLINLLSNAGKFTEGGRVALDVSAEGEGAGRAVVFRVSDTGIGMTGEQLGRLFRRFAQADSSTTRRFGGTGLGLAITKAFCDLLGGRIAVESEPGRGTAFTIRLPADVVAAAPAGAAGAAGEADAAPAPRDGLVLVVDDDPASRDLLSRFVQREGFAVECARDGEEGLRLARRLRPTAILLDVVMPRVDGWAVLSALKAEPELADIPVVMVSIVQEQALAVSLGAADFLTKPVRWPRLKGVLDRYRTPGAALIVEADEAARAELRARLEAAGWTAEEAADGPAALARLGAPGAAPVGLVLVAVPGPGSDGLSLVHALRRDPRRRDLQVVALTGGGLPPEERAALEREVRRVLPADGEPPEELVAELRRLRPAAAANGAAGGALQGRLEVAAP